MHRYRHSALHPRTTHGVVYYIYELHTQITNGVVYCIYEASWTPWYKTDNNDTLHDKCASLMTQCITHTNHEWRRVLHITKNVARVSVSSHVTRHQVMSHIIESCHTSSSHVTRQRVMSHVNESCHMSTSHVTWQRVMSHINKSCPTSTKHVTQRCLDHITTTETWGAGVEYHFQEISWNLRPVVNGT